MYLDASRGMLTRRSPRLHLQFRYTLGNVGNTIQEPRSQKSLLYVEAIRIRGEATDAAN